MVTRNQPDDRNSLHVFLNEASPEPRRDRTRVQVAVLEPEPETDSTADRSRRRHDRVAGPFDGRRLGFLETPIRIYDLSLGGCFVNSMHEQREGSRVQLRIDLPDEGSIVVEAETLYRRQGFGFAVRFIDVNIATARRLTRTIDSLKKRQAGNP
jgi:hypothetical protein